MFKTVLNILFIYGLLSMPVYAAQTMMEHSHIAGTDKKVDEMQSSPSLTVLDKAPASGKAREAGFDNSYLMKQTTVEASDREKCILASRGIVMLDRAGWKKCGVVVKHKPKQSRMNEHNGHAGH